MDFWKQLLKNQNVGNVDFFHLDLKRYGQVNKDKIIYLINEDNKDFGFFAMYRTWIEYLYFADVCNYVPVVCAGENFLYKETTMVHGTGNPFEYYFEQPAAINIQEVKRSNKVIVSDLVHRQMVELIFTGKYNHYKYTKRYMNAMGHTVKKYIRFNEYTMKYIDNGVKKLRLEGEKVLGIHVRGTDFRARYDNHPVYVTEEDCFNEIDQMLDDKVYNKIFLATDDERVLKNFSDRYGKLVSFYEDVKRSNKNQSVAFSQSKRRNHKYLLGLEVIRDMHTLSMCAGLVAGISQVAICAQINKLARGEQYNDLKIIDKGINVNNHIFSRCGKKL